MSRAGRRLGAGVVTALLLALAACRGEREPAAAPPAPPDATYTVRGVVWGLPAAAGGDLVVFHEAIPDFVDRKGERSGMDSMTMPFGVAPDVELAGLAEGDKVEITFELRWQDRQPLRIVRLDELPGDTEVRVGAAAATGPGAGESPAGNGGEDAAPSPSPAATAGDADHAHH